MEKGNTVKNVKKTSQHSSKNVLNTSPKNIKKTIENTFKKMQKKFVDLYLEDEAVFVKLITNSFPKVKSNNEMLDLLIGYAKTNNFQQLI